MKTTTRFDLYGALWAFANRYHSGQWSRGYRILSRLTTRGYRPGLDLQSGHFESNAQRAIYKQLVRSYKGKV